MLFKIIGVLVIIGSSSYIGFLIADYYKDRPELLKSLQLSLQMLETEMLYLSTPLPNAFRNISEKCD
ncbi:MAG TPA: stage III sporulation protein AB, partial [Thermoanaerobacterales bacterium]|nr:stage III sporulation protein AB [Thermoanaerobacterales bacterium]